MSNNIIQAEPTKEFFISMLTRDITTDRAILDLIDNSLDAAMKNGIKDVRIDLVVTKDAFSIKDNAGGLDLEIAKKYAFCFGRSASTPDTPNSIGQFGVGMKRTLFKIGTEFQLTSNFNNIAYIVKINVANWLAQKGWNLSFELIDPVTISKGETSIVVTSLRKDISDLFSEITFLNNLQREIASAYFKQLHDNHKIFFNGDEIHSQDILVKTSKGLGAIRKTFTIDGVEVVIICGVMNRDIDEGGWNVVCNGRLVTSSEQSELTGWGINGIPKYHANYAFFRGLVEFSSTDSSKLPWTTTKTGVDRDSKVFKSALFEMGSCMQPVLTFLKDRAEEVTLHSERYISDTPLDKEINAASPARIYDVAVSDLFIRPTKLTVPIKEPTDIKIQYWAKADKVNIAKEYLDINTNSKLGELSFDYFYDNEIGNE